MSATYCAPETIRATLGYGIALGCGLALLLALCAAYIAAEFAAYRERR